MTNEEKIETLSQAVLDLLWVIDEHIPYSEGHSSELSSLKDVVKGVITNG